MTRKAVVLWLHLFLVCPVFGFSGQDSKTTSDSQGLSTVQLGDQLYTLGKWQDAAAKYDAALKISSNLEPAQAGLSLSLLHSGKIDEAQQTVLSALGAHPDSARLMTVLGKVRFRRGEMGEAEQAFQTALQIDQKNVGAYLGLARLYRSLSLYAHSYAALKKAHDLDPKDPDVQLMWLETLPRRDRLTALDAYLAGTHPQTSEQNGLQRYADYLRKTHDDPPHACKLVNDTEQTNIKLEYVHYVFLGATETRMGLTDVSPNRQYIDGLGVELKVNNHDQVLLLDTGASGIIINRKAANGMGLKRISDIKYGGIGDEGERTGYMALADRIKIGPLEFRDCVVTVTDKSTMSQTDAQGLIGADVFASYLVDIDAPQKVIRLSPLPKRPGDEKITTVLNTEGETPEFLVVSNGAEISETYHPKDRYVASDMTTWTPVFRFDHMLLVPTRLNTSKPLLFLMDTGAFENLLATRAARSSGKVAASSMEIEGASGKVNQVYRAEKVELAFARFHQSNINTVAFDFSTMNNSAGTEISGALGFDLLRMLEIKIDYRDGLVDFVYRDPHGVAH